MASTRKIGLILILGVAGFCCGKPPAKPEPKVDECRIETGKQDSSRVLNFRHVPWQNLGSELRFQRLVGGDVDGDGNVEILGIPEGGGQLVLFPGEEGGGLGSAIPLDVEASAALLGDMDGDGKADLVYLDMEGVSLEIAYAAGGTSFDERKKLLALPPPPADGRRAVLLGDQDADGLPDVVAASGLTIVLARNLGDGEFEEIWRNTNVASGTDLAFRRRSSEASGRKDLWITDPVSGQVFSRLTELGGEDGFSPVVGLHKVGDQPEEVGNTRIFGVRLDESGSDDIIVNSNEGFGIFRSDDLGGIGPIDLIPSPHVEDLAVYRMPGGGNEVFLAGSSSKTGQTDFVILRKGLLSARRSFHTGRVTALVLVEDDEYIQPNLVLAHENGTLAVIRLGVSDGALGFDLPPVLSLPLGSVSVTGFGDTDSGPIIAIAQKEEGKIALIREGEESALHVDGNPDALFSTPGMEQTLFVGFVDGLAMVEPSEEGAFEEVGRIAIPAADAVLALSAELVAVASAQAGTVSLLRRSPQSEFDVIDTIEFDGGAPTALDALDIDCDGIEDLLVLDEAKEKVHVLLGTEEGQFLNGGSGLEIGFAASGFGAWATEIGTVIVAASASEGRMDSFILEAKGSLEKLDSTRLGNVEGIAAFQKIGRACGVDQQSWVATSKDGSAYLLALTDEGSIELVREIEWEGGFLPPGPTIVDLDGDGIPDLLMPQGDSEEAWISTLPGHCDGP